MMQNFKNIISKFYSFIRIQTTSRAPVDVALMRGRKIKTVGSDKATFQ